MIMKAPVPEPSSQASNSLAQFSCLGYFQTCWVTAHPMARLFAAKVEKSLLEWGHTHETAWLDQILEDGLEAAGKIFTVFTGFVQGLFHC